MPKPKLTREELLHELGKLNGHPDPEHAHAEADKLLIQYIDDSAVKTAFGKIRKFYA